MAPVRDNSSCAEASSGSLAAKDAGSAHCNTLLIDFQSPHGSLNNNNDANDF